MIEIKKRITGEVLWSGAAESLRDAVIAAVKAGADLTGAYLTRANLARANLARANLANANLARANLTGANLARADLTGANLADANLAYANLAYANLAYANLAYADLTGANLADANLADADLTGADLTGADLTGADLTGANVADANLADANLAYANLAYADLTGADLTGADLTDADLTGAYLTGAKDATPYEHKPRRTPAERAADYRALHPDVPVVPQLDAKILGAIEKGGALDMSTWHTCETTHCRAGWAIHIAGAAGYALEKKLGNSAMAGRAIYRASTGRSPHFYATTERALADIRRCAAEDAGDTQFSPPLEVQS
jgi:hypothetical protein